MSFFHCYFISNLYLTSQNQEIKELEAAVAKLRLQLGHGLGYKPPDELLDQSIPLSDADIKQLKREQGYLFIFKISKLKFMAYSFLHYRIQGNYQYWS